MCTSDLITNKFQKSKGCSEVDSGLTLTFHFGLQSEDGVSTYSRVPMVWYVQLELSSSQYHSGWYRWVSARKSALAMELRLSCTNSHHAAENCIQRNKKGHLDILFFVTNMNINVQLTSFLFSPQTSIKEICVFTHWHFSKAYKFHHKLYNRKSRGDRGWL